MGDGPHAASAVKSVARPMASDARTAGASPGSRARVNGAPRAVSGTRCSRGAIGAYRVIVVPVDSPEDVLRNRLREGVRRHAQAIGDIASRGEISVVVLEPSDAWKEALQFHGWKGDAVFPMSARMQKAMSCADGVTERWIGRTRGSIARIFAVVDDESFLVNEDGGVLTVEPGSTEEGEEESGAASRG
jgi:hypothetical protein